MKRHYAILATTMVSAFVMSSCSVEKKKQEVPVTAGISQNIAQAQKHLSEVDDKAESIKALLP